MKHQPDAATPRVRDRREARREQTKAEIIVAAWDLVRRKGLAGLAMRQLGKQVGMKAQSIYSYFESKNEIYDAMFHEGYVAFAAEMEQAALSGGGDPLDGVRQSAHRFFEFCTSDPVRYQLLFQRTIPDFVPSEESYAIAQSVYASMTDQLAAAGMTDPGAIDLWTAFMTGLTDQQISNDPGGDRWERLLDTTVDMLFRQLVP